jgi:hypothetical protein
MSKIVKLFVALLFSFFCFLFDNKNALEKGGKYDWQSEMV